jgi:anti-anti-sigma factor
MKASGHQAQVWRLTTIRTVAGGKTELIVSGRLGYSGTAELESALTDLSVGDTQSVVLDLAAVDYISSPGLRLLDRLSSDLKARGATLAIVNATDAVRLALDLAGLVISESDAVKDPSSS